MSKNKCKRHYYKVTAKSICPTINEVKGWNFQELRKFLESRDIKYEDINIIDKQNVDGSSFLGLTAATLERWGILGGPAIKIKKLVKEIQGGKSKNILTAKSIRPTKEVNKWSFQEFRKFLESKDIKYEDIIIIDKQNVDGSSFLELTAKTLERWGILGGPAIKIEKLIKEFKRGFTGEIFLLVDHSNLIEQGKETVKRDENLVDKPNLYIEYEKLRKMIVKGRKLGGPTEIFCSRHSQNHDDKKFDRLWNKRRKQGFVVNLIEQKPHKTREKK
ncbi:17325_t:CDS:2, partial [Funneliformis caledonium]